MNENKNNPDAKDNTELSENNLAKIAKTIRLETNEMLEKMTKAERRAFFIRQQQDAVKIAETIGMPVVSASDLRSKNHGDKNSGN